MKSAEKALRGLVSRAVESGDYESSIRLTELAKSVGALLLETTPTQSGDGQASSHLTSDRSSNVLMNGRNRKKSYPKFFRRGEDLVKIGWSKKDKKEYEHRASRRLVDALVHAIVQRARHGKLFASEQLFPLKNLQDGTEFPGYQAYVALAWLKNSGVIKQHGRRGYSAKNAQMIPQMISDLWSKLSEN